MSAQRGAEWYAWEITLPHALLDDLPALDAYLLRYGFRTHDLMAESASDDGYELGPVNRIELHRREYRGLPGEPSVTVTVVRLEAPVTRL